MENSLVPPSPTCKRLGPAPPQLLLTFGLARLQEAHVGRETEKQSINIAFPGQLKEKKHLLAHREDVLAECVEKEYIRDSRVLRALRKVPREDFFPQQYRAMAWDSAMPAQLENNTLSTSNWGGRYDASGWKGEGHCHISSPYVVAYSMDREMVVQGENVLIIGSCTNYETALHMEGVGPHGQVVPMEVDRKAYLDGWSKLLNTGYLYSGSRHPKANVLPVNEDGWHGYTKYGPYHLIKLCAATPEISIEWLKQMYVHGRFFGPVEKGTPGQPDQEFVKIWRISENRFTLERQSDYHDPFVFVSVERPSNSLYQDIPVRMLFGLSVSETSRAELNTASGVETWEFHRVSPTVITMNRISSLNESC